MRNNNRQERYGRGINEKNLKGTSKILILVFIILFLTIFLTPFIINLLFKSYWGSESFVAEWAAGDALAYAGAILGGLLTLLGVMITINYQQHINDRNEEKERARQQNQFRLENLPVLRYSLDSNDNGKGGLLEFIECTSEDSGAQIQANIHIENVGKNPARDISVGLVIDDEIKECFETLESYLLTEKDTGDVSFYFALPILDKILASGSDRFNHHIIFVVCYSDLIGNRYSQEIHSDILVMTHIDENDVASYSFGISFLEPNEYKLLTDGEEYKLPPETAKWKLREQELEEKYKGFSRECDSAKFELLDNITMKHPNFTKLDSLAKNIILKNRKIEYQSSLCFFKHKNETVWNVVREFFCSDCNGNSLMYHAIFEIDILECKVKIVNVEKFYNEISTSKIIHWRFSRKLKSFIDKKYYRVNI